MKQNPPNLVRVATVLSWLLIAAGCCIVAGWQFRVPILKGQAMGTFVSPNTALSFICSGISILLQLSERKWLRWIGTFLGAFVFVFALATAAEYVFHLDVGIDRIFMAHRLSDWYLPLPGRYTTNATIGFLLSGISLLTLRRRSRIAWAEIAAALVLLVSYLSIVAFLLGASALIDQVMAVHTAVLFAFLGVALLAGSAQTVLLGTLLGPFAGAIASRKMILSVLILLPFFGAVELWAEQAGLVSLRLGTALSIIASVTVFTVLALRTAGVLNETDRKRLEGEAALMESIQLAAAGRMAASIAHEVNNPLESVTNLMYLLKNESTSAEQRREYLEIAEKELTRVAAIARRTLGFYREDTRETEVDVCELMDGVIDIYRNKLSDTVTVRKFYCEDAWIKARTGEVRQVLTNLLTNAIDALPIENAMLEIKVQLDGQFVTISIRDNGHGIPAENLRKIFDPFFTTKKGTGTGLGLWVSRDLVLKNKGTITVVSSVDPETHGTEFQLTFPSTQTQKQSPLAVAENAS